MIKLLIKVFLALFLILSIFSGGFLAGIFACKEVIIREVQDNGYINLGDKRLKGVVNKISRPWYVND